MAKIGNILYASLTLSGRQLRLYRYTMADGRADWFNPKGDSVRKALLRTPVDGAKITSGFGMRMHPILGYSLMHKGVDFGAPIGTPIYAAGDGVIQQIGPFSGYGNYIRIKHNSNYATAYGHMSRFAGGLHTGSHVRQGQVIAYVGMTGRATGPHLHYEVLVNGKADQPAKHQASDRRKTAGQGIEDLSDARRQYRQAAPGSRPVGRCRFGSINSPPTRENAPVPDGDRSVLVFRPAWLAASRPLPGSASRH